MPVGLWLSPGELGPGPSHFPSHISLPALGHGSEFLVPVCMAHLLYLTAGSWRAVRIS